MLLNDEIVTIGPLVSNLLIGIVGLFLIMYTNVFFGRRIALLFEIRARIHLNKKKFNSVMNLFFFAVILLVLTQVLAVLFWATALYAFNLVPTFQGSILFAGSCYMTIGFISDILPSGWKFVALFIALSGLFSVALSTTTMLNMMPFFRQAWLRKHAAQIKKVLVRYNLPIPNEEDFQKTIEITSKTK